jgi:hypothetical protein
MPGTTLHNKLRQLIGEQFDFVADRWVLIEVLGEMDSLVLRRCSGCRNRPVQANSYGQPTRRVVETMTIPISDPATGGYSEDVLTLLAGRTKPAPSRAVS